MQDGTIGLLLDVTPNTIAKDLIEYFNCFIYTGNGGKWMLLHFIHLVSNLLVKTDYVN